MAPREIKYCPHSMKDILTSMKDTSELMVDLAYSAVIYNNKDIAEEVLRLEEKMDTLGYHIKIAAMLAARRIEEAEALSGALQIAAASEHIANAAGDIAKTAIYGITLPELKTDLRLSLIHISEPTRLGMI